MINRESINMESKIYLDKALFYKPEEGDELILLDLEPGFDIHIHKIDGTSQTPWVPCIPKCTICEMIKKEKRSIRYLYWRIKNFIVSKLRRSGEIGRHTGLKIL